MRITNDFSYEKLGFVCEDHLAKKFFLCKNNKGKLLVMNDRLKLHTNSARSYEEEAVFRNENFILGNYMNPLVVAGYTIYPVFAGATGLIEGGVRIYFQISTCCNEVS